LGCGSISAQEQICVQELVPNAGDVDMGRSHQGLLLVHGRGGTKQGAMGHHKAIKPWLGSSVLIQKKEDVEKSH